jgi:hypothetical protein
MEIQEYKPRDNYLPKLPVKASFCKGPTGIKEYEVQRLEPSENLSLDGTRVSRRDLATTKLD